MSNPKKTVKRVKAWAVWSVKSNMVVGVLPFSMESYHQEMLDTDQGCAAIFEEKKWAIKYRELSASHYKVVPCLISYQLPSPTKRSKPRIK